MCHLYIRTLALLKHCIISSHWQALTSCMAGNKCRKVFESALGKVLFIDEAYRWELPLLVSMTWQPFHSQALISVHRSAAPWRNCYSKS